MAETKEVPSEQAEGESVTDASATAAESDGKQMRGISLTGFGGIRMVRVQQIPEVQPREGEVLIRVKACGLNFTDLMVRQGAIDNPPKTPFTMGFECAGDVEALGENVDRFAPGDRVIAFSDYKAWAELVAVPAQFVYKLPANMNYQDGASLLMNYVTGYMLLFDLGNIQSEKSVLVHSAAGGVGHAVCQMCKTVPDVTVFGTASVNKHEAIKSNLDHVFDRCTTDYCQEIRKVTPEGVDLVLDSLCGEDTNRGVGVLKPLGKYILFGTSSIVTGETKSFFSFAKSWWQIDKINPLKLYEENKTICGFNLRQLLFKQNRHEYVRKIVQRLFTWYAEGKIKPVIDSTWAFEDIGDAMQKLHEKQNVGKVLLDPSMEPKEKAAEANGVASSSKTWFTSKLQFRTQDKQASSDENKKEESEESKPAEAE